VYDYIFLVFRALRRFASLKDEIQYRMSMYGQVPPRHKSFVTVGQEANGVNHRNGDIASTARQIKKPSVITPLSRILPDRLLKNVDKQGKHPMHHNKTINDLKVAFSEYYLMLVLLQRYQLLNFTGFRKVLKKHDKRFHTTRGDEWR
jgi:hypothetical protein